MKPIKPIAWRKRQNEKSTAAAFDALARLFGPIHKMTADVAAMRAQSEATAKNTAKTCQLLDGFGENVRTVSL